MKLKGHEIIDFQKLAQDMSGQPIPEEAGQPQPDTIEVDTTPPQLTDQEKWDMFDKYVKLLEEANISKSQLEDSKNTLEQLIWGTINPPVK